MKRYYKPIRQIWHKPTQQQQAWLLDRGSLTERLQQAGTHFEVRLVEQGWRNINRYPNWFAQMLQNKCSQFRSFKRYWFREVQLWLNDQCMVTAISYTPAPTMQQQAKFLTKLSNRSLGSILFSNRRIQRRYCITPSRINRLLVACVHLLSARPANVGHEYFTTYL